MIWVELGEVQEDNDDYISVEYYLSPPPENLWLLTSSKSSDALIGESLPGAVVHSANLLSTDPPSQLPVQRQLQP